MLDQTTLPEQRLRVNPGEAPKEERSVIERALMFLENSKVILSGALDRNADSNGHADEGSDGNEGHAVGDEQDQPCH